MSSTDSIDVAVQVVSDAGDIPDDDTIRRWVHDAIVDAGGGPIGGMFEISVRVVDEAEIRSLNLEYRDKDKSTNVLSFPVGAIDGLPPELPVSLGDIVVCAPVITREASDQGKTAGDHWAHMLVHGTLHLLGYDHVNPDDAHVMEAREVRILSQRGIQNPYNLT